MRNCRGRSIDCPPGDFASIPIPLPGDAQGAVRFGQHPAGLGFFLEAGYTLTVAQPFDLFPQTRHLECVLTLLRARSV
jgi:hypothetical protein